MPCSTLGRKTSSQLSAWRESVRHREALELALALALALALGRQALSLRWLALAPCTTRHIDVVAH